MFAREEGDTVKKITLDKLNECVTVALDKIIEAQPGINENKMALGFFSGCSTMTHATLIHVLKELDLLQMDT
jgi:hypothetical protein